MYRVTTGTCAQIKSLKKQISLHHAKLAMNSDLIKSIDADFDVRSAGMAC